MGAVKEKERENAQFVEIGGKKFVILSEEDYEKLLDRLDDIEIDKVLEDESDPIVPWEEVKDEIMQNRISEARKAAGLTQKELAKRMKIEQSALSRLEKKGTNLTIKTLKSVAKALGCEVHELV